MTFKLRFSLYYSAAQTDVIDVYDGVLPLGYRSLRSIEYKFQSVALDDCRGLLFRLTVTYARRASKGGFFRLIGNEIEFIALKTRMVYHRLIALRYVKHVILYVLAYYEPRLAVSASAYAKTFALSNRVIEYSVVSADYFAVQSLDITLLHRDILAQELAEVALANEANARGVLLVSRR